MTVRRTGAEIFFRSLLREGVEILFGYPGGAVLPIYDLLPRFPGIRHITVRHEQAAAHAADGYARATGRPGVCLATSGPGATNLVTGLATAYMDSVPVVAFTGQVTTDHLGRDAFQEVDIVGMTRTCTKHNYLVRHTEELETVIKEAFLIASSGRPGPVLVDLPKDVLTGTAPATPRHEAKGRGYSPPRRGHPLQIQRAVSEILRARRPVLYAGGGIIHSGAHHELRQLAEMARIPVTLTLMGLGGFPSEHPLFLGMLGMHGTYAANRAVSECDLLIAVGSRFDDRATGAVASFAPRARIVHIDIDPCSIGKNIRVHIPIVGDARVVLGQILQRLEDHQGPMEDRSPWLQRNLQWRRRFPLTYTTSQEVIKPQHVVREVHRLSGDETIIATEVGQNQMWAAQFFPFRRPRTLLSSGGLGTMGYGLPAAIGAQAAFPHRRVVVIAGDASLQMNIQEMATAVQYGLSVKVVLLNNRSLGMVRQWQSLFHGGRHNESILEVQPDFVKLAEAYGVLGLRATEPQQVVPCLQEGLSAEGPVLMDFWVDPHENVYPIVPPGRGIDRMILRGIKGKGLETEEEEPVDLPA
jgi:acetolactate synthase-1/2/3 large subunit